MMLNPPQFSSDRFSWKGNEGRSFKTDVAGLGPLYGRVYDDACDLGMQIVSTKTKSVQLFVLTDVTQSDPCEYVFESVDKVGCGKFKVRILNT